MNKCPVCGGRTIKTDTGSRCMNAACEGSVQEKAGGVVCECGSEMNLSHASPYGDRTYTCPACTSTRTY